MQQAAKLTADVVVVGAGIAGSSAFFQLAKKNLANPSFRAILIDALPPMSLTSKNGTFMYRNWFPKDDESPQYELVSRSLDLLDEYAKDSNNEIQLNRNGDLYVTRDESKILEFKQLAMKLEKKGGGQFRFHSENDLQHYKPNSMTLDTSLDGSDLVYGKQSIAKAFPSLGGSNAIAALHVRRAGTLDPFGLINYELRKAKEYSPNSDFVRGKVTDVWALGGKMSGLTVADSNGGEYRISTPKVVFATGPKFEETFELFKKCNLSDFNVPIRNELHARAVLDDPGHIMGPTSPVTWDSDPIGRLEFPKEGFSKLPDDVKAQFLQRYPSGVHVRHFEDKLMAMWSFDTHNVKPLYPVEEKLNEHYGEICAFGLCKLFPQLKPHLRNKEVTNSLKIAGGYLCKTLDGLPMIGPAPSTVHGVYLDAAMASIGVMSSAGSGELLAAHVMEEDPNQFAVSQWQAFLPSRFENEQYVKSLRAAQGA